MNNSNTANERLAKMTFASVYPHYVTKVKKKGRSEAELQQVIEWLTGYNKNQIEKMIEEKISFAKFFERAILHPNAPLITGMICGYRIEDITDPFLKKVRWLDKLVDELAKGRKMEKIWRG